MKRYRVTAKTITVNGSRVRASSPAWLGLDMSKAEPRQQSTMMLFAVGAHAPIDVHLSTPFQHPDDTVDHGCFYRVRPKMEVGEKWQGKTVGSVAFERWDGEWFIAVGYGSEGKTGSPIPPAPTG